MTALTAPFSTTRIILLREYSRLVIVGKIADKRIL